MKILIGVIIGFLIVLSAQKCAKKPDVFNKPYYVHIVDEHEIQCISKDQDTVVLYFENSYVISEETILFIKKK